MGNYFAEEDKRKCDSSCLREASCHWTPAKKLVLLRFGMLRIERGTACESGDLMEEGSVKYKRETCSDKNSPKEPEILIIQRLEPLILDQCWRLFEEPLLTVRWCCMVLLGVLGSWLNGSQLNYHCVILCPVLKYIVAPSDSSNISNNLQRSFTSCFCLLCLLLSLHHYMNVYLWNIYGCMYTHILSYMLPWSLPWTLFISNLCKNKNLEIFLKLF